MLINKKLFNKKWKKFVIRKDIKKELHTIELNLKNENYYPEKDKILRFFENDPDNLKYIVVGMDPYPQSYEIETENGTIKKPVATGRSFEPANYDDWRDSTVNQSINNILKAIYYSNAENRRNVFAIRTYIDNKKFFILPPHELFDYLEKQGIMFLNYSLTVKPDEPRSHLELWRYFSNELIKYIDTNYDVTWLLCGEEAKKLSSIITKGKIIEDAHPATHDFYNNNKCFKKIKDIDFTGEKKH